jgi:HD-GYP domain-containing protein (c-di-GMP phosphodiesterase class II)
MILNGAPMTLVHDETDMAHTPPDADEARRTAALGGIVEALSRALELHDYRRGIYGETAAHTERVMRLACRLAERTAPELVSDPELAAGFRLHDIGMIGVPVSVLAKPGPLTADEVAEIKEHPWLGERIVAPIAALGTLARQVIACHHERWDGSGYPRNLRGAEIPMAARIFAVVDAFDSMTNAQPYREALSLDVALAEIEAGAGAHFDPAAAAEFVAMIGPELTTGPTLRSPEAPPAGREWPPVR